MAKARILLAHGNADCQTIYGSVLVHEGYDVDIAGDVETALGRLANITYDLVIADLYIPSTDDECLVRRMRHAVYAAHVPVVVLTGWTTEAHRRIAIEEDADQFLPLPTRPRELMAVVAALLEQPPRQRRVTAQHANEVDHPITNGI